MPKIVRFHETGAAEVLKLEDLPPHRGRAEMQTSPAEDLGDLDLAHRGAEHLESADDD